MNRRSSLLLMALGSAASIESSNSGTRSRCFTGFNQRFLEKLVSQYAEAVERGRFGAEDHRAEGDGDGSGGECSG